MKFSEFIRQVWKFFIKMLMIGLAFVFLLYCWYKLPLRRHSKFYKVTKVHIYTYDDVSSVSASSADSIIRLRIQFEYSIDKERDEWTSEFRDFMMECSSFGDIAWRDTAGIAAFNNMLVYSGQALSTIHILVGSEALLYFHRFEDERLGAKGIDIGHLLGLGIDYYEDYPSLYCSMTKSDLKRFVHILRVRGIAVVFEK